MRTTAYRRWLRPFALIEPRNDEPVDASVITYRLGQMTVAQSTSGVAHYVRDEHIIARSRFNDCLFLRLLVQGKVRARFGDGEVEINTGDIYLTDLSQASELWVMEDSQHINVMLPRSDVDDMLVHGRVLHAEWLPCRMLREHLLNFIDILRHCNANNVKEMINATLELLRFCLRTDDLRGNERGSFSDARERIVQYIDQHLTERTLGAAQLQKAFGISRAQLYRQFAELGGIKHYIRNKRLQSVLHDLCNERQRSITDILELYGFSNERQFQRAFRARFGMTASQVRAGWKSQSVTKPFDDEDE
ncbi:helix-turn-helix domain-containing protein [Dyella sp. 2HG41-7]|uniref:helix-turn-helix domain-containing protein n=1 Tax=Dyella sp. 2HG41-7 TaxID=2883239 RepID=UPI001F27B5C8|nr:helix-turn-helix domain-containing protein [Dyella sp. 2HG41-7]